MKGKSAELYVPTRCMGAIMGLEGSDVEELRLGTRAEVKIHRNSTNKQSRVHIRAVSLTPKLAVNHLFQLSSCSVSASFRFCCCK